MTKRLLAASVALALAGFAIAACGGGDDSSSTSAASTPASTSGSGGGGTIDIAADPGGALAFTETDLTAKAGSDTIDFENDSSTPHNVQIEDADGNAVGGTDDVTGGSTSATVDLEPGTYTFYCDIPGHEAAGMKGTITVK